MPPKCRSRGRRVPVDLGKRLASQPKAVDRRGYAHVNGNLEKYLRDLLARESVIQRSAYVSLEFVRPIECADHCEIEHAALTAVKAFPAPDRAPAIFGHEFLQRPVEIVHRCQGLVHIGLPEHFGADLKSLGKWFASHIALASE